MIKPIATIIAAGVFCFHGPQPGGSFVGIVVSGILLYLFVALLPEVNTRPT
jgi:hypothetical protein